MDFISHMYSDVGIKKETNQDSALIMEAQTDLGNVMMCVLCDGMGGLSNGELASAEIIRAFSDWFKNELKTVIYNDFSIDAVKKAWCELVYSQNTRIMLYSRPLGINMGTTVVALLIFNDIYCLINVGDSRIYKHNGSLEQLTEDQTFVNREVKLGNMTPEQAKTDPRRNVLLQCVGASQFVEPEFSDGSTKSGDIFILCSDGFRHEVTHKEIEKAFEPSKMKTENDIAAVEKELVEANKLRKETDNITVIAVKAV